MADPKHSDSFSVVLYGTDDSVVPDSISPESGLSPAHRLPEPARIFLAREAFSQIP